METPQSHWFERVKRSSATIPALVLLAVLPILVSEMAYRRAADANVQQVEAAKARLTIGLILRRTLDAETGQLGYLLTGRPAYLMPYREAITHLDDLLPRLELRYAQLPDSISAAASLDQSVRQKLSLLQTTIDLYQNGRSEAWRDLLMTDMGRDAMDNVRAAAAHLTALENAVIAEAAQEVDTTLRFTRAGVAGLSLLTLLAMSSYLRQSTRLDRLRTAQADSLELEVKRQTVALTQLAQYLQTVREDERGHLARELHDELGALMTTAKLDAARIRLRLGKEMPEALERLTHLTSTLDQGIALKRRIIEDLKPSSLANLGLVASLDILTREFADRSGLQADCTLLPVELSPEAQLTVYRIVQEGLTNVAKYSQAKLVQVRLGSTGASVEITVEDDGIGFDVAKRLAQVSHGLVGMQYRVQALGGTLKIESQPGRGTRLSAVLPMILPVTSPDQNSPNSGY